MQQQMVPPMPMQPAMNTVPPNAQIEIIPQRIYWQPVDNGSKPCQFPGCQNLAYAQCQDQPKLKVCCSSKTFRGCGQYMCVMHTRFFF